MEMGKEEARTMARIVSSSLFTCARIAAQYADGGTKLSVRAEHRGGRATSQSPLLPDHLSLKNSGSQIRTTGRAPARAICRWRQEGLLGWDGGGAELHSGALSSLLPYPMRGCIILSRKQRQPVSEHCLSSVRGVIEY